MTKKICNILIVCVIIILTILVLFKVIRVQDELIKLVYKTTYNEYVERRNFLVDKINQIPGCYTPVPMGAFYTVARLPVDDADKFCQWCLSEFEYEGQTVFMAPASGFYTTPGMGKNEVRIAYVLNKEDLGRAMDVLRHALDAYPGRQQV